MALYSTFKYGSGVYYGVSSHLDAISPDTGPSTGGNAFIITGANLDPQQWDDDFLAGSLDLAKWTDISSGSGSVSTGADHLQMDTGATPGSVAGIESVAGWTGIQAEVRAFIPAVTEYPDSSADVFVYQLRIDANNHTVLKVTRGNAGVLTLTCESTIVSTVVDTFSTTWTPGLSTFKILRYGAILYFIANGIVIHTFRGFSVLPVFVRLWAANDPAVAYTASPTVELFKYRTFVVFGDQPVHDVTTVSDYRIRGLVVPSVDERGVEAAYAGPVDLAIVGEGVLNVPDAYEYYYLDSLRVINSTQSDVKMSFISDDQIKTKTDIKKGVGL